MNGWPLNNEKMRSKPRLALTFAMIVLVIFALFWFFTSRTKESEPEILKSALESYKTEDFNSAIVSMKKVIETEPNNADHYNTLGSSYFTVEDYENALANFRKALEIDPNNFEALTSIGSVYRNFGNYNEAFYYYNRSLSINPNYAYAYDGIGTTYYFMHDYVNAINYLSKAYKMDPRLRYTATFLADAYLVTEDFDSLLNITNDKIRYNPDNYDMYSYLGYAYLMRGDVEPAIFFYSKAINLTPKTNLNRLTFNNAGLGLSYLRAKDYSNAITYFENSLSYGKSQVAYGGLAATYYFLGDAAKSESYFKKINLENTLERIKPVRAADMRLLGMIYWDSKAYDKAIEYYRLAVWLNPTSTLYFELGQLYAEAGNKEKAIESLMKSLELKNDNLQARKLLQRLTTN